MIFIRFQLWTRKLFVKWSNECEGGCDREQGCTQCVFSLRSRFTYINVGSELLSVLARLVVIGCHWLRTAVRLAWKGSRRSDIYWLWKLRSIRYDTKKNILGTKRNVGHVVFSLTEHHVSPNYNWIQTTYWRYCGHVYSKDVEVW